MSESLSVQIAERMFGWKWIAMDGIPTRSTPGYPTETRVRQFFSPKTHANKQWQDHFAKTNATDATGDEPLSYCYCSSCGPEMYPHFEGDENAFRDVAKLLVKKGLWDQFVTEMQRRGKKPTPEYLSSLKLRCRVALEVWPAPSLPKPEPSE